MKIFWSWQSDNNQQAGRHFVREALETAAAELGAHPDLAAADRPEVDSDTMNVRGSPPIAETILRKIDACAVFVADVTSVAQTKGGKRVPNPNVMIELGYALARHGHDALLLVMNTANGSSLKSLPFDLRHWRKPIMYALADDASEDRKASERAALIAALKPALAEYLSDASQRRAEAAPPAGMATSKDTPALWADAGATLRVRERLRGGDVDLPLTRGPMLYARIIPCRPPEAKRADLLKNDAGRPPLMPIGGYASIWHGPTASGAASWSWNPQDSRLQSLTHWFSRTGEIWAIWPDFLDTNKGQTLFSDIYIGQQLVRFLRHHLRTQAALGAPLPWRIVIGATGLDGALFPLERGRTSRSLQDAIEFTEIVSPGNPSSGGVNAAYGFMSEAYDAFGLESPSRSQMKEMFGNGA